MKIKKILRIAFAALVLCASAHISTGSYCSENQIKAQLEAAQSYAQSRSTTSKKLVRKDMLQTLAAVAPVGVAPTTIAPVKAAPIKMIQTTKKEKPALMQALDAMRSTIDIIDASLRDQNRKNGLLLHSLKQQITYNSRKNKDISALRDQIDTLYKRLDSVNFNIETMSNDFLAAKKKNSQCYEFINQNIEAINNELTSSHKTKKQGDFNALNSLKRLEKRR